MTRHLRCLLRRLRLPWPVFALAACSSVDADPEPHCIDDGLWIAHWECVELCFVADGRAWGSCERPDEQTACVQLYRGEVASSVRWSDMAESTWADVTERECL